MYLRMWKIVRFRNLPSLENDQQKNQKGKIKKRKRKKRKRKKKKTF